MLNSAKTLREAEKNSGVYKISNIRNGRVYIGSSTRLRARISVHKSDLNAGRHLNKLLQEDWINHGAACFKLEIVCFSDDPVELIALENAQIEKFDSVANGYNRNIARGLPIQREHNPTDEEMTEFEVFLNEMQAEREAIAKIKLANQNICAVAAFKLPSDELSDSWFVMFPQTNVRAAKNYLANTRPNTNSIYNIVSEEKHSVPTTSRARVLQAAEAAILDAKRQKAREPSG